MLEVLKATMKTGSGSVISVVLMAIASKIMAVILGPTGIGIYSMLVQLNRTATQAGSIGGGAALIQGLASREGRDRQNYIVSVFWIFLLGAGAVTATLLILADFIAPIALGSSDSASVGLIRWLAIPVTLAIVHTYVRGVLTGFRAIGRLAFVEVSIASMNAILAYPVSMAVDSGYAIAFIVMMSASFASGIAIGAYTIRKEGWTNSHPRRRFLPAIQAGSARHFFSIASVTVITGFLATGSFLAVRALVVYYYGLDGAGIFNAAWTIGMVYALLALTSMGTYYLPTLSQITENRTRNRLMNQILWVATFLIVPLSVLAISFKPLIVQILYSAEFLPALDVIRWMLPAVYIKSVGWVLAMPILAYAQMRVYLITEGLWYLGFVGLSIVSVAVFDSIEGIGASFLLMCIVQSAYVTYYATRRWTFKPDRRLLIMCLLGVVLATLVALMTWDQTSVGFDDAVVWVLPVIAFMFFLPRRSQRHAAIAQMRTFLRRLK